PSVCVTSRAVSASARSCGPSRSMSWSGWYLRNSSISAILRLVISVVTPVRLLVVLLLEGNAPVTFSVNHRPDSTGFYTLPGTLTTFSCPYSGCHGRNGLIHLTLSETSRAFVAVEEFLLSACKLSAGVNALARTGTTLRAQLPRWAHSRSRPLACTRSSIRRSGPRYVYSATNPSHPSVCLRSLDIFLGLGALPCPVALCLGPGAVGRRTGHPRGKHCALRWGLGEFERQSAPFGLCHRSAAVCFRCWFDSYLCPSSSNYPAFERADASANEGR